MESTPRTDTGLKGWFRGGHWKGSKVMVWVAWIVTILLLAVCVLVMLQLGHTSPAFSF